MVINTHAHIFRYPEHFNDEIVDIYVNSKAGLWWNPKGVEKREYMHVEVDDLIKDMDEGGVDKVFLMGHVWRPYDSETPLDWIGKIVRKHSDRFIGFHVADPLGGVKATEDLERAVSEYGFKGLKLFPAYNHIALNDKRMYPLFEKAQTLKIPVILHTGWCRVPKATMESQRPTLLDEVGIDFPDLKVIMGHCGFQWAIEALMLMKRHKNFYGDLAYWHIYPKYFVAQVLNFAKCHGVMDRVLWGTDFPHISHAKGKQFYLDLMNYMVKNEIEPLLTEEDLKLFFGDAAWKMIQSCGK